VELESAVLDVLGGVHDPCCREREISIVDMGLVRSIEIADGHADVELMLTSGWCPFAARILDNVREEVEALDGIDSASVEITWDEAWTPARMAPAAVAKLRFLPEPAEVGDRDAYLTRLHTDDRSRA
jgi:metal-sulfur cluster biosynthetic enzyme